MPKICWGIDVSRSSVKAVRLDKTKQGIRLTNMKIVPYALPGSPDSSSLEEKMIKALREVKSVVKSDPVVVSLPSHSAFNRLIKVPMVGEIEKTIQYEAQNQIPFGLDQVVWGYQIVESAPDQEEKEAIIIAIKKDVVEEFLNRISPAKLNIIAVQLSPVALFNFLNYDQNLRDATIILDMGADNASLIVMDSDKFWVRNLPITGSDITKSIQKSFKVPIEKAEAIKVKAATLQAAEKVYTAIQPVYKNVVSEIHRSLGFYKSVSKQTKFARLMLLGNATKVINFQRFIAQSLQMPAENIHRLGTINVSDRVDPRSLNQNIQTLGTSLGLAIQGLELSKNRVNLIPESIVKARKAKKRYPVVAVSLAIMFVALIFAYISKQNELNVIAAYESNLKKTDKEHDEIKSELEKSRDVQKLLDMSARIKKIGEGRQIPAQVIRRILDAVATKDKDQSKQDLWILKIEGFPEESATTAFFTVKVTIAMKSNPAITEGQQKWSALFYKFKPYDQSELFENKPIEGNISYSNDLKQDFTAVQPPGLYEIFPITYKVRMKDLDPPQDSIIEPPEK